MVTLFNESFYTIDEVVKKSGYTKGTLYNLTNAGILSPPIRGLDSAVYPSQGLYKCNVFDELTYYQAQKLAGKTKREIIMQLRTERNYNEPILPLLETRG